MYRRTFLEPARLLRQTIAGGALTAVMALPAFGQAALRTNTTVRITRADQQMLEGKLVEGDSSDVVLSLDGSRIRIARTEIVAMSRRSLRTGTYARRFALGTGIAFGLLGGAIGSGCSHNCGGVTVGWALFGGAFGAAKGAIAGAAIGSVFHQWTPVPISVQIASPLQVDAVGSLGHRSTGAWHDTSMSARYRP